MYWFFVLFLSVVGLAAQAIPGRYIVELQTPPAVSVSVAKRARYSAADLDVAAHRARIQAEHAQVEASIRALGGGVTDHYDTLVNAMAVNLIEQAAVQLRQMPNVKGVYPVNRHHKLLDHAVNVHRVPQAWQTLSGGSTQAGAGIKIAIFDSGIDVSHPGFQGFTTAIPKGFPLVSSSAETANTNNKVIVSRVYSDPAGGISNTTGADLFGHGTGVAMIAAGLTNDPKTAGVGPITGLAPGAWLGNYKIADDNGNSSDVTFLSGLQDAVNDGMSVVNYSYGGPVFDASDESGVDSRAIASALAAGTLVVVAAGNGGPDLETIASPGVAPSAITVGASENERFFWSAVTVGTAAPYLAVVPPALLSNGISGQISGPLIDVTALDNNGFGCSAFPANSLAGQIALISRGGTPTACPFDAKINNAQAAGAVGVVIYDNKSEPIFDYTVDTDLFLPSLNAATLPTLFVSQTDGQQIQQQVKAGPGSQTNLDFDGITSLPHPSNLVSSFSSGGPSPGGRVKPDILAVGDWYVTADSTQLGGSYPPYTFLDTLSLYGFYVDAGAGTSFAAPVVSGALAVVMAARPGLSAAQYRSLVVNGAAELDQYPDNSVVTPQVGGAGRLDLLDSLQIGVSASPSSLDFLASNSGGSTTSSAEGSSGDAAQPARRSSETVTITNVAVPPASDTFTVSVKPLDNVVVPSIDMPTFTLAPGASQQITLSIPGASGLSPGQYHGFISIAGTKSQAPARVAYWYGVPGTSVQFITRLQAPFFDAPGATDSILFRCTDLIGLPLDPASDPVVTTSSPRAQVLKVTPTGSLPGTFKADIQIGRADADGLNIFTITADGANVNVEIFVQ
jgi:minor extracellular serine protease Vpr